MSNARVLIGGMQPRERSVLQSWMAARGLRASFVDSQAGIIRALEEAPPDHLVLDTGIEAADIPYIARVALAAFPALRITFVGSSAVERAYLQAFAPERARWSARPIDPLELLDDGDSTAATSAPTFGWPSAGTGSLAGFARIFVDLLRSAESGTLYVGRDVARRVVSFGDGIPTYCDSRVLSENLGQFLLSWGVVDVIQYEWARNLQLREGMMQGEALVKIGVLTQEKLEALLARQAFEKLVAAVLSADEPYRFESDNTFTMRAHRHEHNPFTILIEAHVRALSDAQVHEVLDRHSGHAVSWSDDADPLVRARLVPALGPNGAQYIRGEVPANRIAADEGGARRAAAILSVLEAAGLTGNPQ